ncbi:MAG TPA: nucleotidyltransferase domain-containing protein [Candidatus Nanoarchaeia archaeon]|nr:nucleotidyltransferase domain-containing protein [Candidatus Nanoarchaeia archaeon]
MLLDICLGSKSAWRILVLYGESPGAGFTRQDLRNYTKLGNKALSFALNRLIAFGILTKSKEQLSLAVYKMNKESKYIQDILNLLQRERQDLNHLPYNFSAIAREFAREAVDSVDALSIHLFGSVAKGTYREDSDIDFAVVVEKKTPKEEMAINAISDKLSKKCKRKIQCFLMTPDQFTKNKTGLAEEIMKHGIKLV